MNKIERGLVGIFFTSAEQKLQTEEKEIRISENWKRTLLFDSVETLANQYCEQMATAQIRKKNRKY